MVCDGACAGRLLGEGEEAEPPALLLLLVVHDDHLDDFAVAGKEGPEVRLRDAGRQAAEEHLLQGRILIDTPMRDELPLRLEVIHRQVLLTQGISWVGVFSSLCCTVALAVTLAVLGWMEATLTGGDAHTI